MPSVTLAPFNNLTIAAASGVYRLRGSGAFPVTVDLLNVGAGTLYIRVDADPTTSDPLALQLPANWALSQVTVDSRGLGVIAGADTVLSVRTK